MPSDLWAADVRLADLHMDGNGEFHAPMWGIRRSTRRITMAVGEYDENLKRLVVRDLGKHPRMCYVVFYPGVSEYTCRTRGYAGYLKTQLNRGFAKENLMNEKKWLLHQGRQVVRAYDPGKVREHVGLCQGLRVRSWRFDIDATSWFKWYESSYLPSLPSVERSGSYTDYMRFRKNETLDKTMDHRVYELVQVLTGDSQGGSG